MVDTRCFNCGTPYGGVHYARERLIREGVIHDSATDVFERDAAVILRKALARAIEAGYADGSVDGDLYQNDPIYHAIVFEARSSRQALATLGTVAAPAAARDRVVLLEAVVKEARAHIRNLLIDAPPGSRYGAIAWLSELDSRLGRPSDSGLGPPPVVYAFDEEGDD